MDIQQARSIWGSDMSDEELQEWLLLSNQRKNEHKKDQEHEGETIEVRLKTKDNLSANTNA